MQTRYLIITSILFSIFLLSGCSKDKKDTLSDLTDEVEEIRKIEDRSENMNSQEDAFNVLRDLNQSMKRVRDACLSLDSEFRETKNTSEKERLQQQFSQLNSQIDRSLNTISNNLDPYKDEEDINRMLDKLRELMISK